MRGGEIADSAATIESLHKDRSTLQNRLHTLQSEHQLLSEKFTHIQQKLMRVADEKSELAVKCENLKRDLERANRDVHETQSQVMSGCALFIGEHGIARNWRDVYCQSNVNDCAVLVRTEMQL